MISPEPATPATGAELGDPRTCGEDLSYNIRRAFEYAPGHCGDCLDYHMLIAVRRSIGRIGTASTDRGLLVAQIGEMLAERAPSDKSPFDIVIAGSGDTQTPAVCAHAVHGHGADALARVRFTILDRCDTPLQLCRDFAARHGLSFDTRVADLVTTTAAFPADLVVIHNTFSFIATEHHVATLSRIAGWLKPGGRIYFTLAVRPAETRDGILRRNAEAHDLIRASIAAGTLAIREPLAVFEARLARHDERRADISDAAAIFELFARCKLRVHRQWRRTRDRETPAGSSVRRETVTAVLTRVSAR